MPVGSYQDLSPIRGRKPSIPLHEQIHDYLLDEIQSGRLLEGEQIPTESALMELFDVSRTTVRRALHDLATRGLISRLPGRGSFVLAPRIEQELRRLTGFVEDMEALGLKAEAVVITNETLPATAQTARHLGVRLGEPVVHIERIRMANRQPISFDDSYLPLSVGDVIARQQLEVEPFYSILEDTMGVMLGEAEYVLEASTADARIAGHLQTESGAAVLLIQRTTFSRDGREPLIFEYLHYRGDRMRYRLHLSRTDSQAVRTSLRPAGEPI